jgi:hypothetical protein
MIDSKEAKWIRMFNRLDVNDQRDVGENMSKLSNAIDKMVKVIVNGGNVDAYAHISLEGELSEKCLVRWIEICKDKGWELRVRLPDEESARVSAGAMFGVTKVYDLNLRLVY